MPRDKSQTHARVMQAAKAEFMEKGFEGASIRKIAEKCQISSAALYRHCKDKDDLFCQVVEPAILFLRQEIREHKTQSMEAVFHDPQVDKIYARNEMDLLLELLKEYPEEARLLFCKAEGTSCQNYVEELMKVQEDQMLAVLDYMREQGFPALQVDKKEMHVMITAYFTAMLEPFFHGYSYEEAKHCYRLLNEFFMPGWKTMMGF